MKHSNLYLGLVLPSGGWQSLIEYKFENNKIQILNLSLKSANGTKLKFLSKMEEMEENQL
jgi:hypothetical protein